MDTSDQLHVRLNTISTNNLLLDNNQDKDKVASVVGYIFIFQYVTSSWRLIFMNEDLDLHKCKCNIYI